MFASNVFFQSLFFLYPVIHISYKEILSHPGRQLQPKPIVLLQMLPSNPEKNVLKQGFFLDGLALTLLRDWVGDSFELAHL